jgi:peptidoglycan/LPS O-acetylase OafA/YrhL
VYSLFFLALIIAVSRKQYKILVNPVMAYIGKISYSIYITHFAVMQILGVFKVYNLVEETSIWTTWINLFLRMVITTGLSILVSHFTYHLIEKKFELIGKSFIKKLFSQPLPAR